MLFSFNSMILMIVASLVAVCGALAFAHFFVRPVITDRIRALTIALDASAAGDHSAPVSTQPADEIGRMGAALLDFRETSRHVVDLKTDLETALEKEKELSALQRQFVSMVTHEFRTPLAIMDGKARQIHRRAGSDAQDADPTYFQSRARDIRRAIARLINLTESVLSASRLDEGKIAYAPAMTDLGAILTEARANAASFYPDRHFDLKIDGEFSSTFLDETLIRQVVSNLLSNAGKYTDPGGQVEISLSRDPDRGQILIEVSDNGIGVSPDELDRLSERFFRAKSGVGRPGTGIGLYLIAQFLGLHGGRLEIKSDLGFGSRFRAILPDSDEMQAPALAS